MDGKWSRSKVIETRALRIHKKAQLTLRELKYPFDKNIRITALSSTCRSRSPMSSRLSMLHTHANSKTRSDDMNEASLLQAQHMGRMRPEVDSFAKKFDLCGVL